MLSTNCAAIVAAAVSSLLTELSSLHEEKQEVAASRRVAMPKCNNVLFIVDCELFVL